MRIQKYKINNKKNLTKLVKQTRVKYQKINTFLDTLSEKDIKYLKMKLQQIENENFLNMDFIINFNNKKYNKNWQEITKVS